MDKYPNWFETTAKPNFSDYLLPYAGKAGLNFLQVGAYTGDASKWLLDNVLTHESSTLTDVDTWNGSDEAAHKEFDWNDVEATYDAKVKEYGSRVNKIKSDSLTYLRTLPFFTFDFIYIDGDHTALGVFSDAVGAWPLLKPYGVMAFDDYTWGRDLPPSKTPRPGILLFTERHKEELDTLVINSQYWIKKK